MFPGITPIAQGKIPVGVSPTIGILRGPVPGEGSFTDTARRQVRLFF